MFKGSRTIYSLVIVSFGWWKGRRGCHFLKNYIAAKRNAKKSELRLLKPWKMRKKANPKIYSRRYSWKHRGWFSTNLYRWRQKPLLFFSVMVRIEDFCKCEKHFHVFTVDRRFVAISTRPKKSFFLPLSAKTQIDASTESALHGTIWLAFHETESSSLQETFFTQIAIGVSGFTSASVCSVNCGLEISVGCNSELLGTSLNWSEGSGDIPLWMYWIYSLI